MHRFKASKFKNSTVKHAKKEDSISDIFVETPHGNGNHVAAGAKFMACNIGSADSGKVGVFKVNDTGRMGQHPSLAGHGDAVTDIEFSPFYHDVMLTASEDSTVKLWKLPDQGLKKETIMNPYHTFTGFSRRPELLQHHPVAESIIGIAAASEIQVWNINAGESALRVSCSDAVQSISWTQDGKLIAATDKGKMMNLFDPRTSAVVQKSEAHSNHKDSRVICLGESGKIATTGFSKSRNRELKAWDCRNMTTCLQTMGYDSSTGVLMPFFDQDAKLLFLAGKGDSSLVICEVTDGAQCISQASQTLLPEQTKGMALLPKLCVDVMSCEVDRLIQLCSRSIVPIKIEVPRRSHTEYASELYPDTDSDEVVLSADDWLNRKDAKRLKTSLDPSKRKPLSKSNAVGSVTISKSTEGFKKDDTPSTESADRLEKTIPAEKKAEPSAVEPSKSVTAKPFAGVRQCKFRHWTGTILHPSTHITNVPQASRTVSSACDGFHVNTEFAAIPLPTPGGPIVVIELSKVGRITSELPTFQTGSTVTDFKWNPFDNRELAVALDNGLIKIWNIPKTGMKQNETEPNDVLEGRSGKVTCIAYHPLALDVLASASTDMNVIIWNLESNEMALQLGGHEEEILYMAWSQDGKYLATVAKDGKIRVYEPRKSTRPVEEGPGPAGSRGARAVWVCDDQLLLVSGFSKQGIRTVSLHDPFDLQKGEKTSLQLDNSPATLSVNYDSDSSTVFLTGKGDTLLSSYEVSVDEPYLYSLATFSSDNMHQGFSFLPKASCDPRKVEFAKAWRLGKSSLEPISFKVPRIKMEYFQDDLFPDTRVNAATMTVDQWLNGANIQPKRVSLRPSNMKLLSEAPKEAPKQQKYESYNPETYKTDEEKKEELLSAMSKKLDLDKALEQDTMEGVDDDEWDD